MSDSGAESEEDILVTVEFTDPVPACNDSSKIKIVGLETDTPILQYEKQVFKGEWAECLGTKMIFGEKKTPERSDPAFSPQVARHYECIYAGRKVLRLKSIVLTSKDKLEGEDSEESEEDVSDDPDMMPVDVKVEIQSEDFAQPGTSKSADL